MGDLSKNFSRSEFVCNCGCGFDTVDAELIMVLQDISDTFGAMIQVSGGNRCAFRNAGTEGAAKDSLHMDGKAADFRCRGIGPAIVYNFLNDKYPNKYGIGLYPDRVHIDVRKKRARWSV